MTTQIRPLRLVAKALAIFILLNAAFPAFSPALWRLTIYNVLVPGRPRLPQRSFVGLGFDIALPDLPVFLNSLAISKAPKTAAEYRVLILGDSQTWGPSTALSQTLAGQLNGAHLSTCGKDLRFYNLAYPRPSILRDFVILDEGLAYGPDLVLWMLTADSLFPKPATLDLIASNSHGPRTLLERYGLQKYGSLMPPDPSFLQRTLSYQKARVHGWALLQMRGLLWAATGEDYELTPEEFNRWAAATIPRSPDVTGDLDWHGLQPPRLPGNGLYFDVLPAVHQAISALPVLAVVQPMFIASGNNSAIRYNLLYPRWAFDQFREKLQAAVTAQQWHYLDLHRLVPNDGFVDGTYHLTAEGNVQLAHALTPAILQIACQ